MMTVAGLSGILALLYLALVAVATIIRALRTGGRREDSVADHDALASSRFTIPVSVVVPVRAATSALAATLDALLALNYPEFEVIVVCDALPQGEWTFVRDRFELEAKEFYYRQALATGELRRIYRSRRDPRLMIVEKAAALSYADTLNCGINLARYRYIGAVPPGLTFDADALLRAMTAALRDPAGVVAATAHVDVQAGPFSLFQRLVAMRSLMASRLIWRHLAEGLGPADRVTVWRRDALVQQGGFLDTAADPEIEMMVRLQTASDRAGAVVRTAEIFGSRAPRSIAAVVGAALRRQRSLLETLWTCRRLHALTAAYLLASEVLTPLAMIWLVALTLVGAMSGSSSWGAVALVLILLSCGQAAVTGGALLLRGKAPNAPDEPLSRRLLFAAPFELVVSAGLAACVQAVGGLLFIKRTFSPDPTV